MPASLRLELFTTNLPRSLHLYIDTLHFRVRTRKDNYVFMQRDEIFLAVLGVPPFASSSTCASASASASSSGEETQADKESYRRPPRGVEIVLEVDDLEAERDRVVEMGWVLDEDITWRPWGLWDFRIVDPDGYCKFCLVPWSSPFCGNRGVSAERGRGWGVGEVVLLS